MEKNNLESRAKSLEKLSFVLELSLVLKFSVFRRRDDPTVSISDSYEDPYTRKTLLHLIECRVGKLV